MLAPIPQHKIYRGVAYTYKPLTLLQVMEVDKLHIDKRFNEFLQRIIDLTFEEVPNEIPYEDLFNIAQGIYIESTNIELESIERYVNISLSDTMKNYNCESCKRKKLDVIRNCAYLKDGSGDKNFSIQIDRDVYTQCPKSLINFERVNIAFEAYEIFKKGFLPVGGGWFDQTMHFCVYASTIDRIVKQKEYEALKKAH